MPSLAHGYLGVDTLARPLRDPGSLGGSLPHPPQGPSPKPRLEQPFLLSGPAETTHFLYITPPPTPKYWDGGRGMRQVGGALSQGKTGFPLLNLPKTGFLY